MLSFHKVKTRLLAIVAIGMVTLSLVSIFTSLNLGHKIQKYEELVNSTSIDVQRISELNSSFKTQVQEWKNVLLRGHNKDDRDKYWERFVNKQQQVQMDAKKLLDSDLPSETLFKLNNFIIEHDSIFGSYEEAYNAFVANDYDHKLADKMVRGIDREPSKLLTSGVELAQKYVGNISLELKENTNASSNLSYGIVVLSLLIGLYFTSYIIQTKITNPLSKLITQLKAVSHGNYDKQVIIQGEDEISQMAKAVETVRNKLFDVVNNLGKNQHELNDVTRSVLDSANSLNAKADQQFTQALHITDTTTQMKDSANQMNQSVQEGLRAAELAAENAKQSQNVMKEMLVDVASSTQQIQSTSEVIGKLDEDTKNVGTVVDVINSIAEQTNLLALNAAIEAARAGEQGRGFAVVADEVRTLASRTQQSTEEIKHIIASLQDRAVNAVKSINSGRDSVAQNETSIKKASLAISEVDKSVLEIIERNEQIMQALNQQLALNQDINHGISILKDTSQQNREQASALVHQNKRLEEVTGLLEKEARKLRQ